ncbi:MAG: exodeoxyribonuclease III [Thermomicrobiales bacterium]
MKIYSWNVNGIRAVVKKDLFHPFMAEHQPDILCLNETKAAQGQAIIDLPDYHEHWNSAAKAGYSGTAIFSKEKPIQVISDFPEDIATRFELGDDGYGDPNKEGRVIAAEFENLWLVSVYTPNSKDDLTRLDLRYNHWDPAFLVFMKRLEQTKPVIFCGDLNVAHQEIDLANPKPNRGKHGFTNEERERFQDYLDAGFIDSYRSFYPDKIGAYTWWSQFSKARDRNVGWRIDYMLASGALKDRIIAANIHPDVMGSDHCPVSIEI